MLQNCFYLLVALSAMLSFSFSNVTLYPEGKSVYLGSVKLRLRNLQPLTVNLPPTNFSSTSDVLSFDLASPFLVDFRVDVYTLFFWAPAYLRVTVTGGAAFSKNGTDTCDPKGLVREYCDVMAHVVVRGILNDLKIVDLTFDACQQLIPYLSSTLKARERQLLPEVAASATDISESFYFRKFALLSRLSQKLNLPQKNFIAKNAMQVSINLVVPLFFDFDTANPIMTSVVDTAVEVTSTIKTLLNISTCDNVTDGTTIVEYGGGSVTMPSLTNVFLQVARREFRAALSAYVPASASLVYDVVVNDLQCNFYNTICSIPAENGIQVMNAHFTGVGDFNGFLDTVMGKRIDEMMTTITFTAVKSTSYLFRQRYYLSPS